MKATEQLIKEHADVVQMLEILEKIAQRMEQGEKINPLHLEAILDFLVTFVDKSHHGKEEKLLFPALTCKGIPNQGGPVGVMLAEHVSGRNFIKGMSEAATEYRKGHEGFTKEFVVNARNYISLLSQHIHKENNILFKMADSKLSDDEQVLLQEQFAALERNEIGLEKSLRYHQILLELTDKYQ